MAKKEEVRQKIVKHLQDKKDKRSRFRDAHKAVDPTMTTEELLKQTRSDDLQESFVKDLKSKKSITDEESLLSAISSNNDDSIKLKLQHSEKELLEGMTPYTAHADLVSHMPTTSERTVPLSRFRRELNSWMKRIKEEKITVTITRKNIEVCQAVPHNDTPPSNKNN
jgi:hypothetical protein